MASRSSLILLAAGLGGFLLYEYLLNNKKNEDVDVTLVAKCTRNERGHIETYVCCGMGKLQKALFQGITSQSISSNEEKTKILDRISSYQLFRGQFNKGSCDKTGAQLFGTYGELSKQSFIEPGTMKMIKGVESVFFFDPSNAKPDGYPLPV